MILEDWLSFWHSSINRKFSSSPYLFLVFFGVSVIYYDNWSIMHISDIIEKIGTNHIWRYFRFLHWQKLHFPPLPTLLNFFLLVFNLCKSGLQIIHYILKISRYTNILYIGRYLVLTYIERFIWTVGRFFSYICWSLNSMSWVSKLNNFFLTCTETVLRFIF